MDALLWLTLLFILLYYWFDTAKAKETAVAFSKKACRDMNVQFLDDSVIRYRSRLARGFSGQIVIKRSFRFEFTLDGTTRETGFICLSGQRLLTLELDYPDQSGTDQSNHHSNRLYMHTSYSEESNALRSRTEKRPDCRH
ncbi:DUF3301 domain-containing protein [Endozoicomonas atrinae]|uniref:DUF3301 domain-containing protein n=1 Tax=Endozoicomonas atrinae TaxID=1333660 RepID=UPI000826D041|nr:DUF3301 domain-containing protein [Endozoicomonas atrinae]